MLDPFLGSGTTAIAAMRAGRHSIGVDIEETYLKMARRRILKEQQDIPHQCLLVEEHDRSPRQDKRAVQLVGAS